MPNASTRSDQPGLQFASPHEEACYRLLRVAGAIGNQFHRVLKAHGISESGYWTLRVLRDAGRDGCRAAQVAASLPVRVPDVTRLVDRLEEQGLASRERARDDARAVTIRLTAAGRALLKKLDRPVAGAAAEGLAGLSATQAKQLLALAARLDSATGDEPTV